MPIEAVPPVSPNPYQENRPFDAMQESLQGLNRARSLAGRSGIRMAQGDISPKNAIDLLVADNTFSANAVAIRVEDSMQGYLLNTLA